MHIPATLMYRRQVAAAAAAAAVAEGAEVKEEGRASTVTSGSTAGVPMIKHMTPFWRRANLAIDDHRTYVLFG